jgi:hypothetical protein
VLARRDEALQRGPFARALTLAIEASGLSLQRLRYRLAEQGVHVSTTTLSYWRNGRSRPERPDSLRGVGVLERLLGVPDGALLALLGPRRPRGRWVRPATVLSGDVLRVEHLFAGRATVAKLAAELEMPQARELDYLIVNDTVTVGPDRTQQRIRTRQVLRAVTDRVSRSFVLHHGERSGPLPVLNATRHCRVGRVRVDDENCFLIAELILDRVLGEGDTTILEYEFETAEHLDQNYDRNFRYPAYEHVLQVGFHPAAVPARCVSYYRTGADEPEQDVRDAWISADLTAHVARIDLDPGTYGMRWEWD